MSVERPIGSVTIAYRFRGPRGCGNGGYTSGLLARALAEGNAGVPAGDALGPVEVTLRRPPPLDVALQVTRASEGAQLRTAAGDVVAEATPAPEVGGIVEPVSYDVAGDAEAAFGGWVRHPFAECFVCGTARTPDEALCLRPGALGDGRTACTWQPNAANGVELPVLWGALDCPSGWTADVAGRPIVLGRIVAHVETPPRVGTRCVVMGHLLGEEGRKVHTASAVYGEDGQLLASARQTWIAVDPALFGETGTAPATAAGSDTDTSTPAVRASQDPPGAP